MALHAATAAALQQPVILDTHCLEWAIPGTPLRLSEHVPFDMVVDGTLRRFNPEMVEYGTLGPIGAISEGVTTEAPTTSFVIFPKSNTAMAAMTAPTLQRTRVRIWTVVLDQTTGTVIGDPYLAFSGESDVATNLVDDGQRTVTVSVSSRFSRFLRPNQGARLNNGFHQRCKPGERGLQYMQSVARNIPWGNDPPTGALSSAQQAAYQSLYGKTYFGDGIAI